FNLQLEMQAHLTIDILQDCFALAQCTQSIAKDVEPPHFNNPFGALCAVIFFTSPAESWRLRVPGGPNSLLRSRVASARCASVCKTSLHVRCRARPNALTPSPSVQCDKARGRASPARR